MKNDNYLYKSYQMKIYIFIYREKILSSGLVLKIDTNLSNLSKLILIDKENRYKLDIEFIKKVRVLNKKSIDPKIRYIISYINLLITYYY